jgi:hypothetical protein
MTNQIEFILNHIARKPGFLEGYGHFEAYQEHIENGSRWRQEYTTSTYKGRNTVT